MSLPYQCSCCCKLLRKPVQTTNGHRFCEECFLGRSSTKERCKLCVCDGIADDMDCYKSGRNDVFGDIAVVHDMDKLPAHCWQCDYEGTFLEIKRHMKTSCRAGNCFCCNKLPRIIEKVRQYLHNTGDAM